MRFEVSKKALFSLLGVLALGTFLFLFSSTTVTEPVESKSTTASNEELVVERFNFLSAQKTNFCAKSSFLDAKEDGESLQGSCCSAMDLHRYKEQLLSLEKYSDIEEIPSDPYDIPVELAKKLVAFDKELSLNAEQQAVYDSAVEESGEKGPCCCKCWRYEAFRGLAKFLIIEHDFTSEQIADVWDSADGCGGKGHAEGGGHHA